MIDFKIKEGNTYIWIFVFESSSQLNQDVEILTNIIVSFVSWDARVLEGFCCSDASFTHRESKISFSFPGLVWKLKESKHRLRRENNI